MMAIFPGKVTLKVGASAGSNVELTNIKRIRWRRTHTVTPQTVMNTEVPVGWHQGHKWVEGELHVLSDAKNAFKDQGTAYIVENADNVVIPYFVATLTTAAGGTRTKTFDNAIISHVEEPYADDEDSVWVYYFLAFKVDDA